MNDGVKIGVDFGSTYSTISCYNRSTDTVEAITLSEGEPASIPSVVSISRNKKQQITCGKSAKDQAGKRTIRLFEGFKILLTEPNQEMLKKRGYDETFTPQVITRYFLDSTLQGALGRLRERTVKNNERSESFDHIENLVICVPEIWGKNLTTFDGRVILRNILKNEISIPVGHVQIVTEPEAASAFLAYNYEKETKKSFNGHLLLIDYGGGTLDITLTEVFSNGNGAMEIGYREGGGAGENHPDSAGNGAIGSAGIAYMQAVVENALREAELLSPEETPPYTSPEFIAAVFDLESQLKSVQRMREIEETFGSYGSYRDMKSILEDDLGDANLFISLEYNDEEVPVTFQQLFRAYQSIIEPVFDQQIREINKKVKNHIHADPCDPAAGVRDDFKIALVGGFGSFFLVKAQLAEIYKLDANVGIDLRTKNVSADKREQAISLGAALLAAGKIVLQKTARYSIGLCTKDKNGKPKALYYGIRYHQTIEPGKPYFLLMPGATRDEPGQRVTWASLHGNIESFAIEFSDRLDRGGIMDVTNPAVLSRLSQLPVDGFWYCGFSMDENDVVSFHVVPHVLPGIPMSHKGIVIPLDSYAHMFDLSAIREVTIK